MKTLQPGGPLPITVGALSETGRREENQDCMAGFPSPLGAVYLIADGMGGHRGGAVASRIAVDAFSQHFLTSPLSNDRTQALSGAIRQASADIERAGSFDAALRGMGSTLVVVLVHAEGPGLVMYTAHVGDSRAYLFRDGQLTLLTRDHTQVQWMIDRGILDESSARSHPGASILTRALGQTANCDGEVSEAFPVYAGDCVLLCSDGLSGFASSEQIHAVLQQHPDPENCAEALVQLALAADSNDNITVQVLRMGACNETARQSGF